MTNALPLLRAVRARLTCWHDWKFVQSLRVSHWWFGRRKTERDFYQCAKCAAVRDFKHIARLDEAIEREEGT